MTYLTDDQIRAVVRAKARRDARRPIRLTNRGRHTVYALTITGFILAMGFVGWIEGL